VKINLKKKENNYKKYVVFIYSEKEVILEYTLERSNFA
jgi:hypothetical protein